MEFFLKKIFKKKKDIYFKIGNPSYFVTTDFYSKEKVYFHHCDEDGKSAGMATIMNRERTEFFSEYKLIN